MRLHWAKKTTVRCSACLQFTVFICLLIFKVAMSSLKHTCEQNLHAKCLHTRKQPREKRYFFVVSPKVRRISKAELEAGQNSNLHKTFLTNRVLQFISRRIINTWWVLSSFFWSSLRKTHKIIIFLTSKQSTFKYLIF